MYRSILGGEGCVERNDTPAPHGEVCEQDKEFLRQMREDAKSPGFKHKSKCEEVLEENMDYDIIKGGGLPRTNIDEGLIGDKFGPARHVCECERELNKKRIKEVLFPKEDSIKGIKPTPTPAETCSDGTKLGEQAVSEGPLPDTGRRREFNTGSVRDDRSGKGRYDLLSPFVTKADAILMEKGAIKYDARNWEKGQPVMSFYDSAKRHLDKWVKCLLLGEEEAEDHLAAARWNIGGMIHVLKMIELGHLPADLDDRPGPQPKLVGRKYKNQSKPMMPECHSEPGEV